MKKMKLLTGLCISFWMVVAGTAYAADKTIKVGVLKFGTVNWELDVIRQHKLDEKNGFRLEVVPLGGKAATHVAIQGGAVDVIVSDWIWVSRQRAENHDYTFFPYSNAVGSLMVPADGMKSLADAEGKKLGVAGGPVDKTWLMLRAYSKKTLGKDLADVVDAQFAAPPLLNKLAMKGDLDGVVNFWHFAAKLQAAGMTPLIEMPTMLKELGVERDIPLIGWVFSDEWADANTDLAKSFLQASRDAKAILSESDDEWQRLRPKMKADKDEVFTALRDAFRVGIPRCFGQEEMDASAQTFAILAEVGGSKLVGDSTKLSDGTFWDGFDIGQCEADS